ncbi:MAG: D-glycero-D-manno-heptose 1 7-bisphosphate phosphatase [Caulobacteraceae bacterium]|nr:MAG: D-glycero-D-manno-heptose 1 7-bisphosphate phosphatase [Caulobacteraceae bacterium]
MRQAVILVGGRGTRLGEAARDTPKPLMPIVGDVRFLDYLIENIARHGMTDILLVAGHLGELVEARYHGARMRGATVSVVREPAPAGTAGALRHVADRLDEVFLMSNGDSMFDINYLALASDFAADDVARLALRRVPDGARYGRVSTDGDRITGFHEKDAAWTRDALINGGVYVLRKSVLDLIDRTPLSIETDVFPALCRRGAMSGVEFDGYFLDIGLPETLGEARAALPAQMRRPAVLFDRDGTLNRDDGYTYRTEDLEFLPGAIEAVRACNDAGALAIVITNQSGIARGRYVAADMERFHAHMQARLGEHGAHIDAFYHCPFHEHGVVPAYARADHPDRKPNAGLLRRALMEWPIDATRTIMVGDHARDVDAARSVGVHGAEVKPGELLGVVTRALNDVKGPTMSDTHVIALRDRATRARAWLFNHALPLWWDKGFDRASGCFHERLGLDGEPVALPRRVRVQARQTFVYAMAGKLGWSGPWREAVEAGARMLVDHCIRPDGGTAHLLDQIGRPTDTRRDLYDAAFVIFALAHASTALDRPALAEKATELVDWVKAHWAHPAGGFLEGDLVTVPPRRQNPHMHMLEALLALHEATGARRHLDDALAVVALFETKFVSAEWGALLEYFDDAWTPAPGREGFVTEPGHQFEWAWLIDRVHRATGHDARETGRRIQVHGEVYGVDPKTGFVADEVWAEGDVKTPTGRFWPSTERVKANIAWFERTGDPAAAMAAAQAFDVIMEYCDTPVKGLWRDRRLPNRSFVEEPAPASSFYHAMLAMAELIRVGG